MLDNRAPDHRLRLRFPTGAPVDEFDAATTFDVDARSTAPVDDTGWVHPAPRTFVATRLGSPPTDSSSVRPVCPKRRSRPRARCSSRSCAASVALARHRRCAPGRFPPGPRCWRRARRRIGPVDADDHARASPADARAAEIGLRGVLGDAHPVLEAGTSLLALDADASVLSACKPGREPGSIVVRVLNPTDTDDDVTLTFGVDIANVTSVRLDETPDGRDVAVDGRRVSLRVGPHALRTISVQTLRR